MWEISNSFQLFSFLISLVFGAVYCLAYDFIRALRQSRDISDLTVFIQDIIYFTLISFVTFFLLMALSNGEVRGYIIIGIILGFSICFVTLSRFTLKLLNVIFNFFEKSAEKIIDLVNRFFDIVWVFICKTIKKCGKMLNKSKKIFKKHLKKAD